MTESILEILYHDQNFIAVNKPHGLLVHATNIAPNEDITAVRLLRNQTGSWVFPAHRLDRKTAGVLLFATDKSANSLIQQKFMNHEVEKVYHSIVRGYTDAEGTIDYPVKDKNGKLKEAVTHYVTLQRAELLLPSGKHSTSRYSLLEVKPVSGRIHQIRKHLAHILHPIIGDRPFGCNKQNKLFLENFGLQQMMLHARSLSFDDPFSSTRIFIKADYQPEFKRMLELMGWQENF